MPNIPRETYRRGFSPAPYICAISTDKLLRPAYFIDAGRKLGEKKVHNAFSTTQPDRASGFSFALSISARRALDFGMRLP